MEIKYKNFNLNIDWKSIVGVCATIGGLILLNTLSEREQLKSFKLDLEHKTFALNS